MCLTTTFTWGIEWQSLILSPPHQSFHWKRVAVGILRVQSVSNSFLYAFITFRENSRIMTKTYFKPTDSHSYLEFSSCHPFSMKAGIPYSQILRMRRNCTKWTDFVQNCLKLLHFFKQRSYPFKIIFEAILKVSKMTQIEAITSSEGKSMENANKEFYCITPFNPSSPDIKTKLNELWKLADRSSSTRILLDCNIVFGHTKPKNISDFIIRSNLPSIQVGTKRLPPRCNRPFRCNHCTKIDKNGQIISTSSKRKYKSMKRVSCNSKNLIYCIECTTCAIQYVGQTKNQFLVRLNNHLSDIRLQKDTPISRHFNVHPLSYKLYILHLCNEDSQQVRNKWENYWISRLNTITPKGLNIMD